MERTAQPSHRPLLSRVILLLSLISIFFFASSKAGGQSPSEIQQRDKVLFLPGLTFNVSFAHYSGYITVNEEYGRSLFYWFFEAAEDPESKPIVLWLNGGPGCSSIAFGLAEELGPFHVTASGKGLYLNKYSWNTVANILFLDSPVGVGYSYSNDSRDALNNGDARTAKDSLSFLNKWFKQFPQYSGRDFYLTGESYAGHYVPQLAQAIVRSHKLTGETSINLKGYMVGNALTDDFHDHFGVFNFMWASGLISDQTYKQLHIICDYESFVHASAECERVLLVASEELGNIDPYSIFTPSCTGSAFFSRKKLLKRMRMGMMYEKYDPCTESHSTIYFNLPEVQKALHVNPSVSLSKWETCRIPPDSDAPPDRRDISFITSDDRYSYKMMPIGLKNAGATYQWMMDKVFKEETGWNLEVYVDDLLVKSKSVQEHIDNLVETFATPMKFKMRLNPAKCVFRAGRGKFLGHLLTLKGSGAQSV